ncbi:MAG: UDP-N-acetylmuramate dehydrogenase [Treponema sp.]|nr:UDP-N-acetylmuramate dehydrogenase [Treponema sp.]
MELEETVRNFLQNQDKKFSSEACVQFNEKMSRHTTFKTGGIAKVYACPQTENALTAILKFAADNKIRTFVTGGGSNIVFCDEDFNGIVINTLSMNSIRITEEEKDGFILVSTQSGAMTSAFVNWCTKNSISGMQEFAGLPGSIGGAVYMNARCFNKEISNVFYSARILKKDLNIEEIYFNSNQWEYKKSPFTDREDIILEVTFRLEKNSKTEKELAEECRHFVEERRSRGHFNFPSAGSVFKNNHEFGKPSGAIIDQCGLKGLTNGGAKVADFHGNIIINTGNATSSQIAGLVRTVHDKVLEKTGFSLEPEIIFIQP